MADIEIAGVEERPETFEEKGFPGGYAMTLKRLESWEWSTAQHRGARAAAALRGGAAAIEAYGFDLEEFEVLADPESWEGIAELIALVELGLMTIKAWNVRAKGSDEILPITKEVVSRLFRIEGMRKHFRAVMDRDGDRWRFSAVEGNG